MTPLEQATEALREAMRHLDAVLARIGAVVDDPEIGALYRATTDLADRMATRAFLPTPYDVLTIRTAAAVIRVAESRGPAEPPARTVAEERADASVWVRFFANAGTADAILRGDHVGAADALLRGEHVGAAKRLVQYGTPKGGG